MTRAYRVSESSKDWAFQNLPIKSGWNVLGVVPILIVEPTPFFLTGPGFIVTWHPYHPARFSLTPIGAWDTFNLSDSVSFCAIGVDVLQQKRKGSPKWLQFRHCTDEEYGIILVNLMERGFHCIRPTEESE